MLGAMTPGREEVAGLAEEKFGCAVDCQAKEELLEIDCAAVPGDSVDEILNMRF